MRCPSCNHENRAERRFCAECGVALTALCPACDGSNEPGEKYCGACGASLGAAPIPSTAPSHPAEVSLGPAETGERRHLTALFCDLVGSTDIASRLDPEEWHRISKAYQEAAAAAVTRYGGHVDKFLGDGLVCFFGVPEAHEDDAERAVRAGLAIVDAVQGLNESLHVRVGMHTGSAVVAHGGGASKDVFGDTPNIAARVQGAAEPDTVLMTAATQRLVAGLFVVEERGAQQLKGVPQPLVLYRVVQPSGVRSRLDVSAGHHTPFVGRQSELGVLADAWERVVEGMGQTVLVQGDAGIGKSRLCYQLREQLGDQPHTWLECRCSPYTTGTPFRPVIELVEQALTFQPADTPANRLRKLQVGLERGGFLGDETVALLAEWLELPQSAGYTPLATNPDMTRRKTLETLAAWNLKLAELQPMVVLVEDLHWCDPSSLELLARLVAQSATARVLLVGTARPEFASPWPVRSNLQTLTLSRLTKRQTREMIAALSATRALPEAAVEQLLTRADGIPLFAEELTQAVVEAGTDAMGTIPETLQDSLLARLDRISSAKEVAQRAAVLGREFSYTLLGAVAGMDAGALQQGLARLVEAELVFVRGEPPEATYTFKHALVQEAAYESLLKRTRQQLHGRVVDVLRERFPERVESEPELVARHAEAAGRIEDAVTYYGRAGQRAQARSAHAEAIGQLQRGIELIGHLPDSRERDAREARLQNRLATSLAATQGLAASEPGQAYVRARELSERIGEPRQLFTALSGLAFFYTYGSDLNKARAVGEELLEMAGAAQEPVALLVAHSALSHTLGMLGDFTASLDQATKGLSMFDRQTRLSPFLEHTRQICFSSRVWALSYLGYADQALACANEALELARDRGYPLQLASGLCTVAVSHAFRGEAAAAQEQSEMTLALARENGFLQYEGLALAVRGHALAMQGRGEEGVAEHRRGIEILERVGQAALQKELSLFASGCWKARKVEEGLDGVSRGLALCDQSERGSESWLHGVKGELLLMKNPLDAVAAEACFRTAIEVARDQKAKWWELNATTSLARLLAKQGKRAEARELLAPIYGWFTEGFDTQDLIDAKALLEALR